jgi:hypothetical protein
MQWNSRTRGRIRLVAARTRFAARDNGVRERLVRGRFSVPVSGGHIHTLTDWHELDGVHNLVTKSPEYELPYLERRVVM